MIFYEGPGTVVTWDDANKCAVLRFKGYTEGDDLRTAGLGVLKVLELNRACKLLTDSREMKALTQADQQWIDVDWRRRAMTAGLVYNALVVPKSSIAMLSMNAVVKNLAVDVIDHAYFSDIEEARAWLRTR